LKEGNGLTPYLYHDDMENLIIGYVKCRKVAIENMQFNKLRGRNCNDHIVRICSAHKRKISTKKKKQELRHKKLMWFGKIANIHRQQ
jgi:hypothetical protein